MLGHNAATVFLLACCWSVTARGAEIGAPDPDRTPAPPAVGPSWSSPPRPIGTGPSPAPPSSIRLAWTDPTDVSEPYAVEARVEAARLFAPLGIRLLWRIAAAATAEEDGGDGGEEIRVILLDRPGRGAGRTQVLGSTPRRPGRSSHFWVHVPSVIAVLGSRSPRELPLAPRRKREVGRALGRVIAHELVHAIAPAVPHGEGLMSERLTASRLTSEAIAVPEAVARAVLVALAGEARRPLAERSGPLRPRS